MISNLEFLTHKPSSEAHKQIMQEDGNFERRMKKMESLVQMANQNLDNSTQLSFEGLIQNPKLVSFKLMKLDVEQSCRAKCEIVEVETKDKASVIPTSTEQLMVQEEQR